MAQKPFARAGEPAGDLLRKKKNNNLQIMLRNDASACWSDCSARQEATGMVDPYRIDKVVIDTNTFCPLRCSYCSLAYAFGDPAWENGNCPPDLNIEDNKWRFKDPKGAFLPPVAVKGNDLPSLTKTLSTVLSQFPRNEGLWVELTGGDSAYHPQFPEALDVLAAHGVLISYLSSGAVPGAAREAVLKHVRNGRLYMTVSADAATPATWASIKKRPERTFEHVVSFIRDVAQAQRGNQMGVKFIIMNENAREAGEFVNFFASQGVRKFVISEYRAQPVHFVTPPPEETVAAACAAARAAYSQYPFLKSANLSAIGVERFFDGIAEHYREPVGRTAAAAATARS